MGNYGHRSSPRSRWEESGDLFIVETPHGARAIRARQRTNTVNLLLAVDTRWVRELIVMGLIAGLRSGTSRPGAGTRSLRCRRPAPC